MDCLARIKELLNERNWSMYQLSQASEIPQSTLSNLFIRNNAPTIPTLEKICNGFGITMAEFFGKESKLNDDEQALLKEWTKLSKDVKHALINLMQAYNK